MEQRVDQLERELAALSRKTISRPGRTSRKPFSVSATDLSPIGDTERRFQHLAIAIETCMPRHA